MDAFLTVMYTLLVINIAVGAWAWHCNNRTSDQRQRMINLFVREPALVCEYARVTYHQHFWCLVRLGNPTQLYGNLTQEWRGHCW